MNNSMNIFNTNPTTTPNNLNTSNNTSVNNTNPAANTSLVSKPPDLNPPVLNSPNLNPPVLDPSDLNPPKDHADLRIRITPIDPKDRLKRDAEKVPHSREPFSPRATLASPEIIDVDLDDEDGNVNRPFSGIDDGFFPDKDEEDDHEENPEAELIPLGPAGEKPEIFPRFGGDDGDKDEGPDLGGGDVSDGVDTTLLPGAAAGGGFDVEIGGGGMGPGSIPDVNVYQHKKTLAQGMMDLALLSANANQLRYVLESYDRHPYFYPSLVLISLSLLLQVAVGIGLIWNAAYNIKDEKEICIANRINNFTVSGIFLVTVVNVFISAFGVAVGIGLIWNAAYNIKDEKEICIANRINNFTVSGIFLVTVVNVFVSSFGVANSAPMVSNSTYLQNS